MKELIHMLSLVPATSEEMAIAKGRYYLSNSWKDIHRINKQMRGYG